MDNLNNQPLDFEVNDNDLILRISELNQFIDVESFENTALRRKAYFNAITGCLVSSHSKSKGQGFLRKGPAIHGLLVSWQDHDPMLGNNVFLSGDKADKFIELMTKQSDQYK